VVDVVIWPNKVCFQAEKVTHLIWKMLWMSSLYASWLEEYMYNRYCTSFPSLLLLHHCSGEATSFCYYIASTFLLPHTLDIVPLFLHCFSYTVALVKLQVTCGYIASTFLLPLPFSSWRHKIIMLWLSWSRNWDEFNSWTPTIVCFLFWI